MKNKHRRQIQNKLFTLKNRDFEAIFNLLSSDDFNKTDKNSCLFKELIDSVSDLRDITLAVQDVLNRQNRCATGIFNALENQPSLFPTFPLPDGKDQEDDSENQVNDTSENQNNSDLLDPKDIENPKTKPRRNTKRITKKVAHTLDKNKLKCPDCGKKMHRAHKKSVTIIRMTSILAEHHEIETARCLTCDTTVEAPGPTEKTVGSFTHQCGAALTALRYVYGLPSYRLQEVTASLGYKVPDSTQWDLFEKVANAVKPFYRFLLTQAARASMVQMDDTYVNILAIRAQFKTLGIDEDPFGLANSPKERTGIHATAFRATLPQQGVVCLFDSGCHHAGEVFEKIMALREHGEHKQQVILMSDALAANTSKIKHIDTPVDVAHCNSHALRKFKELKDSPLFEDHADTILELYTQIFELDQTLKKQKASPTLRLKVHQEQSLPIMLAIKEKIDIDLGNKTPNQTDAKTHPKVEPNSALGKAYGYFLKYFDKLCAFCHIEGAPVCNNAAERMLKRAIRHRKNSLFYKNHMGALVGDMLMTVLITALENGQEPVQYLVDLLDHKELWKQNPEAWLPWNISETKKALLNQHNITPQGEGPVSSQHPPPPKRACEHHHHTTIH